MSKLARTALAVAFCAAALAGAATTVQAQEIRLSTFVAPVHVIYREILTPWSEAVAKATNGEVKVTLYPSLQLGGKPPELFRQVKDGVVDAVFTLPGYTSPAFPRTQMIELPGLKPDGVAATNMMWDLLDPYLAPEYEGTKVIALWGAEDAGLISRSKPIRSLDDLKGMRMRAPSAAQAKQLEVMGAVPVAMPITEVYQSLERGVVDGAMLPFSTIPDFRLGEVGRAYTIAGPLFGRSSFLVAMNRKKYDSLSPGARAAIDRLSGRELSLKATEVYLKRSADGIASVRGKAEVVELSAAEQKRISELLRPIITDWIKESEAKGIPAREMLRRAGHPAGS
ncbi:MAG TPA: TRAP transporter substrate-binding protein [Burkholderiales bacterium]|jgi:TRAP-type C4-dicarboxylate transport system substrate-binding protein|nr:TRAP transporter substrate-binding protein [Burkholderiales bacterium]